MNAQALIGKKIDQTQGFLENGTRVPLSIISMNANVISQVKSTEKEGYNAWQLGFGINKRPDKPMAGHFKKAGIEQETPRFLREIRVDDVSDVTAGSTISAQEVFEPGDIVDVTGTSKGKGFAGVVKRFRFHGGPKTHGQSDRHRARGSSGSGTTPGRVYKGKKMAGRMGNAQVTVKNLEVLDIQEDGTLFIKGLVPGPKGSILMVKKVGKNKQFIPLYSEKNEEEKTETVVEKAVEVVADSTETVGVVEGSENSENQTVSAPILPENQNSLEDEEKEVRPVK